jgi:hypothetical protein
MIGKLAAAFLLIFVACVWLLYGLKHFYTWMFLKQKTHKEYSVSHEQEVFPMKKKIVLQKQENTAKRIVL